MSLCGAVVEVSGSNHVHRCGLRAEHAGDEHICGHARGRPRMFCRLVWPASVEAAS